MRETVRCYWCNSESELIYKDFPEKGFNIFRCNKCKIMFEKPIPDTSELYSSKYFESWGEDYKLEEIKKQDFLKLINMIEKLNTLKNKRLLDIGTAQGYLIEVALNKGWDAWGIESSSAILYKNTELKKRIKIKDFMKDDTEDEKFAVITTISVFEHMPEPKIFVNKILNILEEKGLWVIVIPNINSLSRYLLGKKWPHFNTPHLFYYNTKFLEHLASKHDLEIVKKSIPKFNYSLFYILNQIKLNSKGVISKMSKLLISLLPNCLLNFKLKLTGSNLLVIFRKK